MAEGDELIRLDLDGATYVIDLNEQSVAALRDAMASRSGTGRRKASSGGSSATSEILQWAKANGYEVSERGSRKASSGLNDGSVQPATYPKVGVGELFDARTVFESRRGRPDLFVPNVMPRIIVDGSVYRSFASEQRVIADVDLEIKLFDAIDALSKRRRGRRGEDPSPVDRGHPSKAEDVPPTDVVIEHPTDEPSREDTDSRPRRPVKVETRSGRRVSPETQRKIVEIYVDARDKAGLPVPDDLRRLATGA